LLLDIVHVINGVVTSEVNLVVIFVLLSNDNGSTSGFLVGNVPKVSNSLLFVCFWQITKLDVVCTNWVLFTGSVGLQILNDWLLLLVLDRLGSSVIIFSEEF